MRSALLGNLQPEVVAQLPVVDTPNGQILSDLYYLNQMGRLPDGTVPILRWLRTARLLLHSKPQMLVIDKLLKECTLIQGGRR